ncbi:MAG: uracil-DNA glycosylase family protein [Dehalococcoidia bacterium]
MSNSAPSTILELESNIAQCTKCDLSKTRNLTVPGDGNYGADIMIIGEAPGSNEDKTGKPFAGRAGRLLDELLISSGIERSTVYITNMLKCRPPSNRDPQLAEIAACQQHLDLQISLTNPSVIVTLGRFSFAKFFPQVTLSKSRGIIRDWKGIKILPVYHPAAALYNPSLKPKLIKDFQKITTLIGKKENTDLSKVQKQPNTQLNLFE